MDKRATYLKILVAVAVLIDGLAMASVTLALEVGDRAPDFTLPSTTGEKISLSQFKGKKHVLIQFYSKDFNPT
jgi:peroxiredoxin